MIVSLDPACRSKICYHFNHIASIIAFDCASGSHCIMSGAPVPVPVAKDKILCIADLEKAGSARLTATARGMQDISVTKAVQHSN